MKNDPQVKSIIDSIGAMLDARFKTWEVNFKAYVGAEIKASEARIRKDMATKEDIKDMVRKSDIKDMVRKSDIKDMVRKSDIKDMATKNDINELKAGQQRMEKDLKIVKEDLKTIDVKFDKKTKSDEKRFEAIEEELNIPRTNKN